MASDRIVTAVDVLRGVMELRRRGHDDVLRELEAVEPDLAEHLMEELGSIHKLLLETGATPKRVRRLDRRIEALALVMVAGLRHAHRRLWDEDAAGTPLAQIDPTREEDAPDEDAIINDTIPEGDDHHTNISEEDPPPEQWQVVHRYTRRQAIEDGVLVDLTPWATESGFAVPVACTGTVWHGHVVPDERLKSMGQSERGRTHDLLNVLRHAIAAPGAVTADRVEFEVLFLMPPGRHVPVRLLAVCGPGDAGEPVITVMLPDED